MDMLNVGVMERQTPKTWLSKENLVLCSSQYGGGRGQFMAIKLACSLFDFRSSSGPVVKFFKIAFRHFCSQQLTPLMMLGVIFS